MGKTVNLTPAGLQTPDGISRANLALEKLVQEDTRVVSALTLVMGCDEWSAVPESIRAPIESAMANRHKAWEALVRVTVGR